MSALRLRLGRNPRLLVNRTSDRGFSREAYGEATAPSTASAICFDLTMMGLDEALHQRKSKSHASMNSGLRTVSLTKAIKNIWQEFRGNALAGVFNVNDGVAAICFTIDVHATTGR